MRLALPAILLVAAAASPARGDRPVGHSTHLLGVHDRTAESLEFLKDSCVDPGDCGWLTEARVIDAGPAPVDASSETAAGISMIVRLDHKWEETVPLAAAARIQYAENFADTVAGSPDVHVWIVGNEPNVTLGGDDSAYVDAYVEVATRVRQISGHEDDVLAVSGHSPWSPCFLDRTAAVLAGIASRGVAVGGLTMHPGTGHTPGTQDPSRVTSNEIRGSCPGGTYDQVRGEFRVYQDYVQVVEDAGLAGLPVFATEAAHSCESDGACYTDENLGYFAAMYAELHDYNATASTPVRALTPYRWTGFQDGTPRDFAIGDRPQLIADLAGGATATWTEELEDGSEGADGGPVTEDPAAERAPLVLGGCASTGDGGGGAAGIWLALALGASVRRRRS